LADPDAISVNPGQEVRYKLRDDSPPFFESTVTFTIIPNATDGTCLRIVHQLTDMRFDRMARAAANSNSPPSCSPPDTASLTLVLDSMCDDDDCNA
jgi:hypothetical protein